MRLERAIIAFIFLSPLSLDNFHWLPSHWLLSHLMLSYQITVLLLLSAHSKLVSQQPWLLAFAHAALIAEP